MTTAECQTCEELRLVPDFKGYCPECCPDIKKVIAELDATISGYTDMGLRRIIICQRMIRARRAIEHLDAIIRSPK